MVGGIERVEGIRIVIGILLSSRLVRSKEVREVILRLDHWKYRLAE